MEALDELNDMIVTVLGNQNLRDLGLEVALRNLRNACPSDTALQKLAGTHQGLISNIVKLLKVTHDYDDIQAGSPLPLLVIAIQVLGNLVVNNPSAQVIIWSFADDLYPLIDSRHGKVRNYASMIFHNLILGNPNRGKLLVAENKTCVFLQAADDNTEFARYLLEALFQQGHFKEIYIKAPLIRKVPILRMVQEDALNNEWFIKAEDSCFLSDLFKRKSDLILKTDASYLKDVNPTEILLLLQILGSASAKDEFRKELQKDKSLFINCNFLLRAIHELGKTPNNIFTRVDRVTQLSDAVDYPWFGFKAELVRVVGNLSFRKRDLQDIAREIDAIPLLLECCNIDAKNPYMMQWAIFAIRNICEDNPANQDFIRQAKAQGKVPKDSESVLHFLKRL